MKSVISNILRVVGAGVAFGFVLCGYSQDTRFYVKGDLGGNLTQDTDLEEFLGANVSGYKMELEPGFRGGLAGGFQFTEWAAAELELGFMADEIKSITQEVRVHDATIGNVPFLLNGKLQCPTGRCPISPYIGAGVGFAGTFFDADVIELQDRQGDIVGISGSDTDTVFAWQAFAGLRYTLNERMGLSVEYRYFQSESPSYEAEFTSFTASDELSFGRIRTHAISLAFDFRF